MRIGIALCVCMYVRVFISLFSVAECMYACMRVRASVKVHFDTFAVVVAVLTNVSRFACMYVCVCVYVCAWMYI
jgi:hypothetical protein